MPLEGGVVFGFSLKGGSVMAYVLLDEWKFLGPIKFMIRYMFRDILAINPRKYTFIFEGSKVGLHWENR